MSVFLLRFFITSTSAGFANASSSLAASNVRGLDSQLPAMMFAISRTAVASISFKAFIAFNPFTSTCIASSSTSDSAFVILPFARRIPTSSICAAAIELISLSLSICLLLRTTNNSALARIFFAACSVLKSDITLSLLFQSVLLSISCPSRLSGSIDLTGDCTSGLKGSSFLVSEGYSLIVELRLSFRRL